MIILVSTIKQRKISTTLNFRYGYIPSPFSIFKYIKKLNAGNFLLFKEDQDKSLLKDYKNKFELD